VRPFRDRECGPLGYDCWDAITCLSLWVVTLVAGVLSSEDRVGRLARVALVRAGGQRVHRTTDQPAGAELRRTWWLVAPAADGHG
jgi:hypothetical protein